MNQDEDWDRRQREKEWGERLLLWVVVTVIMLSLAAAFLFQVLT